MAQEILLFFYMYAYDCKRTIPTVYQEFHPVSTSVEEFIDRKPHSPSKISEEEES